MKTPGTVWTLDVVRSRCTEEGDCWLWAQSVNSAGHPQASVNGRNQLIRRLVHFGLCDARPFAGRVLVPRCGNPLCVAPGCIEQIDRGEIMRRAYASGRRDLRVESVQRRKQAIAQGWATKLDMEKAREIRRSGGSHAALAAVYNVHPKVIAGVRAGRYWREPQGFSVFSQGAA